MDYRRASVRRLLITSAGRYARTWVILAGVGLVFGDPAPTAATTTTLATQPTSTSTSTTQMFPRNADCPTRQVPANGPLSVLADIVASSAPEAKTEIWFIGDSVFTTWQLKSWNVQNLVARILNNVYAPFCGNRLTGKKTSSLSDFSRTSREGMKAARRSRMGP